MKLWHYIMLAALVAGGFYLGAKNPSLLTKVGL